ncbi:MAG TPA: phosphoglucosamine mutase, partial [Candidatus Limnocylindrales bacterium]|nr:phosphoglucosamine mutase [Candidatus Limnocylindrales bacterium]
GITSTGASVRLLGITSTPAVAYLSRSMQATAGVVISASHNPIEDNGLKFFDGNGFKLSNSVEEQIEKCYFEAGDELPRAEGTSIGQVYRDGEALGNYYKYLKKSAPSLTGLSLVVDCAHGAACLVAGELLKSLGAKVNMLHDVPDGSLINVNCGTTDTAALQREVLRLGASLGLAFDGDADRLIAVDEKGNVVDGDGIMSICAVDMAGKGLLNKQTLVATVMSNGGLDILGEKHGFKVLRTPVGDRFVIDKITEGNYNFGGEQSGHIIFSDHATTGDGFLAALQLLKVVQEKQQPLSELASCLVRLPQVLINQKVKTKEGWSENQDITVAIDRVKQKLGPHGRILVRPSGTEQKIRVMLEAPLPEDKLEQYARSLAEIIAREQSV